MRWPNFCGGSYVSQSVIADCEQTINWYVEQFEIEGAQNRRALYPTPGFEAWCEAAGGVVDVGGRAFAQAGSRVFAVIGGGFYELFETQTATRRGDVAQDSYPATISYNGIVGGQLFITSGGNGYNFALATNTLTQVLTNAATMGAFCKSYFLAFDLTTGRVRLSNPNDGTVWDASIFFQRSDRPDPYQCMFVDDNSLVWLIGRDSFEVRYLANAAADQPFEPYQGMGGPYGIVAPFAWKLIGPTKLWLARNQDGPGPFVAVTGSEPRPISTYAISAALSSYARSSTLDDGELLAYRDAGHTFAIASFPRAGKTWCVDVDLGIWTELGRWNSATGVNELWTPRTHLYAWGQHLVGDRSTAQVIRMDRSLSTELDGTPIRRVRVAPALSQEHQRRPIDQIELLIETGVGLSTGTGSDPQITIQLSGDGGQTYGAERMAGFGKLGEFQRRVYWTRFGIPPNPVAKVVASEPVPTRIVDAWINGEAA